MDSIPPPAMTGSFNRTSSTRILRPERPKAARPKVAIPYSKRLHAPPGFHCRAGDILAGDYEVAFPLGRGGMSTVYLAKDLRLGRFVALKILHRELAFVPAMRRRFYNEVEAANRIDHPAVVRMWRVGELGDGRLFSSMEYVRGISLKRKMAGGPLPVAEVLCLAATIAKGLEAAHRAGVVHRDLKPGNVLLPLGRRRPTVKIVDFGIASLTEVSRVTGAMEVLGTPLYIAPEQARGDKVDNRADIYSFGAIIYEMLTGTRVFDGRSPAVLLSQHLDTSPIAMRRRRPDLEIPAPLEDLVMACLRKSPIDRPRQMGQILTILDGLGPDGEYLN